MGSIMDLYRSWIALPGELKLSVNLMIALVIVWVTLSLSADKLIKVGCMKYGSPNWITIWRFPLFVIGLIFYFGFKLYLLGTQVIILAIVMDRLDGKVAELLDKFVKHEIAYPKRGEKEGRWPYAYRKFQVALYHPGRTEEGEVLDAFIDKCKVLPTLLIFAFMGLLSLPLTLLAIAFDIIGTFIRPPFRLGQRFVRTGKATAVGKVKFFLHCMLMFGCMVEYQQMIKVPALWLSHLNVILTTASLFGFMSVVSRLDLGRGVNRVVDWLTSKFAHTSAQKE
jgi:phosphatidylglycerophosphate synthase